MDLEAMEKGKIVPARKGTPVFQPVVSRYIDWAIPAPHKTETLKIRVNDENHGDFRKRMLKITKTLF
jgi:hypothetical protein